jgi:glycosyltransferase involved in cell wall biosynthesis
MGKNILVISTDATRTGTPILLLSNIRWIKGHCDYNFIFILRNGGVLLNEFQSLGQTFIWNELWFNKKPVFKALFRYLKIDKGVVGNRFLNKIKREYKIDLIYSNSARNGDILRNLHKGINCSIHEGEKSLNLFPKSDVEYNMAVSSRFVVVSAFVRDLLLNKYKCKQPISVIPGATNEHYSLTSNKSELLIQHGIAEDSFVLMCCGWLSWHKGTDFFIQLARVLTQKNSKFHFVWVGGSEEKEAYKQLEFDIDKLGLKNRVSLITSKPNILDYINLADIFLMLSREESFSLVTVEAGLLKKSVFCFEQSGGPCEIVGGDKRFIVPYADLEIMASRIEELYKNRTQREEMGDYLHKRVLENYTIEKTANQLLSVIKDTMEFNK